MNKLILTFGLVIFSLLSYAQSSAIKVEVSGKGSPILYLPGFITPGSVWEPTVQAVEGTYESHLVSYAGFGGLPAIGTPWYSQLKDALIAYANEKNLWNLTVVGHSMGGNLAVDLAAAVPERVAKLVLVDALPCMRALMMPGVTADQIQYDSPYNNQTLQMQPEAFTQMARMMAQNMTASPQFADTLTNWMLLADRKTYVYGYTDLLKLDLRPDLGKINTPTLILGAPFPTEEMVTNTFNEQYSNLKNQQLAIAPAGKHFIMIDQANWFYGQLNEFLK
jgi:pimeloyl-ACP methyl ester carboxylesterase